MSSKAQQVNSPGEPREPFDAGSEPEGHRKDSTKVNEANGQLIEEIRALQQRLFQLESEARPKFAARELEEEWTNTRAEFGPEQERSLWKAEKRHRMAGLTMISPSRPETQKTENRWTVRTADEDFRYNLQLFKLRKKWEQKLGTYIGANDSDFPTDTDSDALSDSFEDYDNLRETLEFRHMTEQQIVRNMETQQRRRRNLRNARRVRQMQTREEPEGDSESDEPVEDLSVDGKVKLQEVCRPAALSKMNRVFWAQFKALLSSTEGPCAAIDVLLDEPIIDFTVRAGLSWLRPQVRKTETAQSRQRKTSSRPDYQPEDVPMPERLRINSVPLLQALGSINSPNVGDFSRNSLVLLKPFRMLSYYSQRIKEMKEEFETKSAEAMALQDMKALLWPSDTGEGGDNDGGKEFEESHKLTDGLGDHAKNSSSASLVVVDHLKCLIEFIDNDMQSRTKYLDSKRCQKVFFSDLWYLFQPGVLVIGSDGKQAYRILNMHSIGHRAIDPLRKYYGRFEKEKEEASITIKCVYLDYDGKQLGPVSKVFVISRFERQRAVTSLDIYPLRFHPLQSRKTTNNTALLNVGLKSSLINRGKMFLKVATTRLAAIQPMYYAGPAMGTKDEIESQVVIDFEAAFSTEENIHNSWKPSLQTLIDLESSPDEPKTKRCEADCCIDETVHDDSYVEKKKNEEFMSQLFPSTHEEFPSVTIIPRPLDNKAPEAGLTEDDLAIMSYRVFGFVLRNRQWAELDLTYLSEIQPSGSKGVNDAEADDEPEPRKLAFDELVLPDGHKDVILSLITQHFRNKEPSHTDQADIIRGKGKGLIMLLHGAPGVGKTTTAEGVAEIFKKPLFQLTCGDLGVTAKDVESTLETNFALASRWGCILLLDEADVFLAQRTKEDFQRNGLVAVFLRVLEYYSGILFLTTNRVGDFDEACASRIHISLYYPELGLRETLEVFKLNLRFIRKRFRLKGHGFSPDEMEIGAFAQKYWEENPFDRWNGRQIRNACQTAVALAEYEAQGKSHTAPLNPNATVHLNVSHFKTVADAYLAFSQHLKDIYGTHAARRAKEAGLRAMWVNDSGKVTGSVGPKEAGIMKADRKSRFKEKIQGQFGTPTYEKQQQVMLSSEQAPPYRGRAGVMRTGGGQAYNDPPAGAVYRDTRPQEYYDEASIYQQYNNPQQQQQQQHRPPMRAPAPPAGRARGPYEQEYQYDQQQQHEARRPISYQQQHLKYEVDPPRISVEAPRKASQSRQPTPQQAASAYVSNYRDFGPEQGDDADISQQR
ncbi:hypothetical protein F4777DRAFT_577723 [Nemania sp. FL0916]|nr:hypothetical protein F4777DRAFT_577723 [Nemania sp. FL0916]